jgi:hypothetical protein
MKVTTAVDPMATDAGLPLRHGDVVMTDEELEVEVGEANQQQQNPGHLAKIVTVTNGRAETYHDRPGKAIVNGISKSSKVETLPGDLIVANGDSNHSTPKKLQDKTDSADNRSPRYLLTTGYAFRFTRKRFATSKSLMSLQLHKNDPRVLHHCTKPTKNVQLYCCRDLMIPRISSQRCLPRNSVGRQSRVLLSALLVALGKIIISLCEVSNFRHWNLTFYV